MEFKPGDLVMLKSGVPVMTVQAVTGDEVACIWIDKNKTYRETFPAVVLKAFKRASPIMVTR